VEFRRCASEEHARALLEATRNLEAEAPEDCPSPGDGGFQTRTGRTRVFVWSNVLVAARVAGTEAAPFAGVTEQVATALKNAFEERNFIR
jgi:hypothetical protein